MHEDGRRKVVRTSIVLFALFICMIIIAGSYYFLVRYPKYSGSSGEIIHLSAQERHLQPLAQAIVARDAKRVEELIDSGADVNKHDEEGKSALFYAAEIGDREIVLLLLRSGATPNVTDKEGSTPLIDASFGSHTQVAKMLIEAGAQIDIRDKDGITALHWAVMKGDEETVRLLINEGANPNIKTKDGRSPITSAAFQPHIKQILTEAAEKLPVQASD